MAVLLLLLSFAAFASAADFEGDLRSGANTINGAGITWVVQPYTPTVNLGTCGCHVQGVLRLTFAPGNRTKAQIIFSFDNPKGFSFHVADSITNDGYGGDGNTQSNDAEAHSVNKGIYFYGRDNPLGGSYGLLYSHPSFIKKGGDVTMMVEDGLVTAESGNKYVYLHTDRMFQLAGQSDYQGPVNRDIYIGLNRVSRSSARSGTGLCAVEINWV